MIDKILRLLFKDMNKHRWEHKGTFGKRCIKCRITWKEFVEGGKKQLCRKNK